jgi:hypothetical protein
MMGRSIQNALDSYSRGGSEHSFYDDDVMRMMVMIR